MPDSKTVTYLKGLLKDSGVGCIELAGRCQSCKAVVELVVFKDGFEVEGNGGIVKGEGDPEFKCTDCLTKDGGRISPTRCEVFSRVTGYLRPVAGYNPGKKAERAMRKNFSGLESA